MTFKSHTNLGSDDTISKSMEYMLLGDNVGAMASRSAPRPTKTRRRAKGKGNREDQFCIYRTSGESSKLATPINQQESDVITGIGNLCSS
ncbi:hypothetical protein F5883DRAFT_467093, partial [Diaporthe sp. PMI_573]